MQEAAGPFGRRLSLFLWKEKVGGVEWRPAADRSSFLQEEEMCDKEYNGDSDGLKRSSGYAVLLGQVFGWMNSVFNQRASVIVETDQFFVYEGEYYSQHNSEVRIPGKVGKVAPHAVGPDGFPLRTRWTLREEDRPHKGWRSLIMPMVVLLCFLAFVALLFVIVGFGKSFLF